MQELLLEFPGRNRQVVDWRFNEKSAYNHVPGLVRYESFVLYLYLART
jgi:hypothetical protein